MKQNQFDKGRDNLIYEQNPVDNSLIDFNDKFLYHRGFADVYQKPDGKVYSVYTEDNLPTVTSNRARRNLEKPLWKHIQKQYARNPQGMKTIEDAVTWGGNVAGASALAVGTAPIWLPYVAPAANMVGRVGKQTLQGLDWLFNPTTYRGALLTSYTAAEGINNFRKNPNIKTGIEAGLGALPLSPVVSKGIKGTYNLISKAIKGATQSFNKSAKIHRINKELTKGIKENSIIESYNRIPANKDIGTVYDYLDFLDNIFPKSKMNDVYYHGGPKGITQFESAKNLGRTNKGINSGTKDYGIYFADDKEIAKYYASTHPKSNRELYTVKLNMNRPVKINTTNWYLDKFKGTEDFAFDPGSITQKWYDKLNLKQYNSIYHTGKNPFSDGEIVMFNPEDIHIMGTPQESVMFREYKKFPIKRQVQLNEDIPTMQQQYDFGFKNIIKAAKPGIVIGTPLLVPSGLLIYDRIKRKKQKEKINKKEK